MRPTRFYIAAALFAFITIPQNAAETERSTQAQKILRRVVVRGLVRTRERVVTQYIPVAIGESPERFDPERLREQLTRLRIFSEVKVSLLETDRATACERECVIDIEVREKWSLYPIPVYVKYRDTEIGGAFLVESNALGENKGVALGGLISNRGWQGLIGFTDPHIRYSQFTTTMRYLAGRVFIEDATPDGKITRSYTLMRHDIQTATGYQWRSGFFAGILGGYRSAELTEQPPVTAQEPPGSASVMNLGVRFKYSSVTPTGFFQKGFESQLDLEKGIVFAGENLHVISSANALHLPTLKHQFLSMLFSFQYSHYPQVLEQRLGGWQGTRTLPALLVPADQFAVAAINYQYGFLRFSWATFAGLIFIDGGTARRDGRESITFWGPGAGLRMYLTEITIPALGIDLARDMQTEQLQLSFFIGYNLQ